MATKEVLQARLDAAEEALHQLMIGKKQVEIEYDGHRVKYTQAKSGELRNYIIQLKTQLGQSSGRSKAILPRF